MVRLNDIVCRFLYLLENRSLLRDEHNGSPLEPAWIGSQSMHVWLHREDLRSNLENWLREAIREANNENIL